ncbi:hypothetical protein RD792_005584 [Penstemon davidsonii]|uniref:Cathepsin propeptide inhibitor domain-containing protein n=1 Tax=Penstemon davidsonii TaxID=160366 RepID=A0ABR0DWE6_9LAMI|nr:hypothetical protein RD792_005584 [Penstemon davidsonii]
MSTIGAATTATGAVTTTFGCLNMKTISPPTLLWATSRTLPDASMVEKHEAWMSHYGRTYKDEAEKAKRFKIFEDNVEYIHSSNEAGARPYKLAINQFADLTNEEFQASRNGYKIGSRSKTLKDSLFRYANVTAVPSTMD